MIPSRPYLSAVRRVSLGLLFLAGASTAGCAAMPQASCSGSRTMLDGVCVSETMVDYVLCVRAHDVKGEEPSPSGAMVELSPSQEKKYGSTDPAFMAVVDTCQRAAGLRPDPPEETKHKEQPLVGTWTGMATEYGTSYSVSVKVTSLDKGQCAEIAYAALGCKTIVHCAEPSDGHTLQGVEELIEGKGCVDGGRVTIAQQPNGTVSYLWKGDPRREVVTASLHPDMMP